VPLTLIGITSWPRPVEVRGTPEPNDTVPRAYVRAVRKAGGLPLCLPLLPPDDLDHLLGAVDGMLVTGGGDVDPAGYGQEPSSHLWGVDPERDDVDVALWRRLLDRPVPVLGICRGAQTLNVALGGTLVQHLDGHPGRAGDRHVAEIVEGSRLAGVVGTTRLEVNSLHHQAVDRPGSGVAVTARAADGVAEALEVEGAPHVLAVQWHPETLRHVPEHLALFTDLVRRSAAATDSRH
jgi:putative glutamine amidotransferase